MRSKPIVARGLVVSLAVALALPVGLAASAAPSAPVAQRQAVMKEIGSQMKQATGFATGQTPFDAAKLKALMDAVAANAKKAKGLFPEGSGADPKTEALPKIWEAKADFTKRLDELASEAQAAGAAQSQAEFGPQLRKVGGNCKSCHDVYRKKEQS